MFKLNETYLLSINDNDKGKVTIYNIVNKKHIKIKKRIHKMNTKYQVVSFIK